MRLPLFATLIAASGFAQNPQPPLDAWRSAILRGDAAALSAFYAPDARIVVDDSQLTPQAEVSFWTALKSAGLTSLDPKVLSSHEQQGAHVLVLRITGVEAGQKIVISGAQGWVNQGGKWQIAGEQRSDVAADRGRQLPEPAKTNPQLYAPPADAQAELKEALTTATREHKRVIVVFGANWCYDCHVLDATFRSKDFAPLVNTNYVVVHINIGDEGQDNHDLAAKLGAGLEHGIPSLAVLRSDGTVLVAQKNGEFESTTRIGPQDVRAFLEKWKR